MHALNWQKSSYSGSGSNCLDLATAPDGTIRLRESDTPDTVITTSPAHLAALLHRIRTGSVLLYPTI